MRETRTVDLPAGVVDIQFFGVTDMILPQSAVLEEFEGLRLEGNFDSDVITPAKLLTRSVGDKLTIRRLNPITGVSDFVSAELISAAPITGSGRRGINAVFSTADGVEGYQCSGLAESILLSKLPEGLQSVPVLSTRVVSETSGPKDITLTYLTRGIEWSADYRMDVAQDEPEASLLGWLTLENKTSKSFKDMQLSFVAGALNRFNPERPSDNGSKWDSVATCVLLTHGGFVKETVVVQEASAPLDGMAYYGGGGGDDAIVVTGVRRATVRTAAIEDLGDYKLYRAPQAVSVNAHQTKQIAFLSKDDVEFETSYNWSHTIRDEVDEDIEELMEEELPIYSRLTYEIDNRKEGSLAVPLPRGSLRAMSQRKDGVDVFLGEGWVSNSPVGDAVDVEVSDSFLVTARFYGFGTHDFTDEDKIVSANVELKNATDRAVRGEIDFEYLESVSVSLEETREKLPSEGKLYAFTIPAQGTVRFSVVGKTP